MLTRRQILIGTAAFAATGTTSSLLWAADDRLLSDILIGITDAVTRSYIREHWREGRWDGRYWWHSGRRYSMDEYRRYLAGRARPTPPPPPPPAAAPRPPASGRGPGPGGGPGNPPPHGKGPGNPGRGPGGPGKGPHGPGPR